MWKQNSQRLMAELDKLRSEFLAETMKNRTSVRMEVLEAHSQYNGLKEEFDKLKLQMEELREKQEAKDIIKKKWEREMKVQKDLNDNLALELKRSQEANLELVSKQQMEIEDMDTYSISSEDNKRTSSEEQDFPEEVHGSCVEETVVRLREVHEEQLQEFQKNQVIIPLGMKTLRGGGALRIKGDQCKEEVFGNFVENNRKKISMDTKFSEDFRAQDVEGFHFESGENFTQSFTLHEEGCKSLLMAFGFDDTGLEQNTIIGSLKQENMLKDKEIEGLKQCKKELEAQIARIEEEKSRTEADVTRSLGKSSVVPISKTALKLKCENDELEVHLWELENENICLSERICGLEAVLRHLTEEKESISLLLQDSQSDVEKLQNKVCELGNEITAQKLDFKEKLQNKQQQFFEALEEIQSLKTENKRLQAMVESIMEEHSLLKISNNELRKQKKNLQEHCAILEVEVRDTLELFSGMLNEVEILEASFRRMLKEVSSKERSTNEELDSLVREIHKHNANLARDDSLLNQMYLEKTTEVENLERKVMQLMKQMSTTFDETEREVGLELSCLREDKAMLEAALQEAQGKLKLYEIKIDHIHKEAERKVKGVINELAVSKQNQDILMDYQRKVLSSLENVKTRESKSKNMLRRHEFKLKATENDRQNLAEEVSTLKMKLQKKGKLQDEVLGLKKSLIESEHQNKCLKASFEMLCEDYEEMKGKNVIYLEEISHLEKKVNELRDYKRSKISLEEKIWRLEWELTAKEASCTLQYTMRNEVASLRRTNRELKGKVKCIEEEKEECFKRVKVLEEKLKQNKEEM